MQLPNVNYRVTRCVAVRTRADVSPGQGLRDRSSGHDQAATLCDIVSPNGAMLITTSTLPSLASGTTS